MLIVGLTGGLATGKSTVAAMFRRYGAMGIDADQISHGLLEKGNKCFGPVVKLFGKKILTKGNIDRKKLAAIVFNDSARLKSLCRILFPRIERIVKRKIALYRKRDGVLIIDAPLLIEAGWRSFIDVLIVVKANRRLQVMRMKRRKTINHREIIKRINAQMSMKEKLRLADIVIDNRGSLIQTRKQTEVIWQKLTKKK